MSSLLTYEYKPFVDSSDEESDSKKVVVPKKRTIAVKNEGVKKKNKLLEILSDSDDDDITKLVRDDDDDIDAAEIIAKRELEARKNAQLLLQSISKNGDKHIDVEDAVSTLDTKDVVLEEKLKKIKETMENTKKQLNTRVNTNVKLSAPSQVIFLDSHPNLPKIKTAFERATERKCMEPITIDMLGEYVPQSQLADQSQISDNDPVVKVKTRLNDSSGHIWKWKLLLSKTMGDLKSKLAELYNVPVISVKLSFDGDIVTDGMTPDSLGLTDDDMVDVKIPRELHASAVEHAKAGKIVATASVPNSISSQPTITQAVDPVVRTIITLHLHLEKGILKEEVDDGIILKLNVYSDFTIANIHYKIRSYFSENVPFGYYSWENPQTPIDMNTIIRDLPPTTDDSYIIVKAIPQVAPPAKKGKKPAAKRKSK